MRNIRPDIEIGAVRKSERIFEIDDDLQPNYDVNIIQKYNISTFASIEEAKSFEPDFAIVANPTSCHVKTAKKLVQNNIPVLLEKPISSDSKGLEELTQLCEENKVPVMIGYMMRFHPCAKKMKELIEQQCLGTIYSAILIINSYMPGWHSYEKYNEFYVGQKSLGGGVVLTEIHELDLFHWYFGAPKRLWAVGGRLSSLEIDVEDTVSALLEQNFAGQRFPININMSFVQRAPLRVMIIQGEKGRIEWDIVGQTVKIIDKEADQEEFFDYKDFQRNEMFKAQLEHFLDCLQHNKVPLTSIHNVIDGHLTALGIKRALESCEVVDQNIFAKQETV